VAGEDLANETVGCSDADSGVRVVGFDNERGKADHCHVHGRERACVFVSVETLVEDFIAAVAAARSEP